MYRVYICLRSMLVIPDVASSDDEPSLSTRLARSLGPLCFRGGRARPRARKRARGCEVAGIVSENHRARTLDGGKRA